MSDFRVDRGSGSTENLGRMTVRIHYGKSYPGEPRPTRKHSSSFFRWKYIAHALAAAEKSVPRSERAFFATLVEMRAFAEHREDGFRKETLAWADSQSELPFHGICETGESSGA